MSPTAPGTPCPSPGCPAITPPDTYCEDHSAEGWQGDDRPSAAQRGYDTKWRKVRRSYLREHPLCEHCEDRDRVRAAKDVDHITPLSEGGARLDPDNFQALCRACHNRKTRREQTT